MNTPAAEVDQPPWGRQRRQGGGILRLCHSSGANQQQYCESERYITDECAWHLRLLFEKEVAGDRHTREERQVVSAPCRSAPRSANAESGSAVPTKIELVGANAGKRR